MNRKGAFILFNAAMSVVIAFLVYYLATSAYSSPRELVEAEKWMEYLDLPSVKPLTDQSADHIEEWGAIRPVVRPIARALYTMTPTPAPTPKPTATPVPLAIVINSWTVVSMDDTSVTVLDQKSGEEFDMKLKGPGKAVEFQGQTFTITFCSIDLDADPPSAQFCSGGQSASKTL